MKRRDRSKDQDRKKAYKMCGRKRKFKSSEAGRVASKAGQRKYRCPFCGHWHLTKKQRGFE